jgi:hypothetical protein
MEMQKPLSRSAPPNKRLKRTRRERSSLLSCVGESLKRSVRWLLELASGPAFMKFDFPKLIGELSDEERIRFYEILAHI